MKHLAGYLELRVKSLQMREIWRQCRTESQLQLLIDMHTHYERAFREVRGAPRESLALGILDAIDAAMIEDDSPAKSAQVKCHRGCSHCCRMNVDITEPEAVLLHVIARGSGIDIDRGKLERQAQYSPDRWNDQPKADRACVFLDESGSCRIYEFRPAACRKYRVISEPRFCNTVEYPGHVTNVYTSVKAEVIASAAMTVQEAGPMPGMLLKHEPPADYKPAIAEEDPE